MSKVTYQYQERVFVVVVFHSTDTATTKAQLARNGNKKAQQKIRARRRSFEDQIKTVRNTLAIPLDTGLSFKVHGTKHVMAR